MKDLYIYPFTGKQMQFLLNKHLYIGRGNVIPVVANAYSSDSQTSLDNYHELSDFETLNTISNKIHEDDWSVFLNDANYAFSDIECGRDILCTLQSQNGNHFVDLNVSNMELLEALIGNQTISKLYGINYTDEQLQISFPLVIKNINARVIGITSIGGSNNKEEIAYTVAERLRNSGRKVGIIFPDSVYKLFGNHYICYDQLIKKYQSDCIPIINNYVYGLCEEHSYDDIVVVIPGDAMMYSNSLYSSSGFNTYVITQALPIATAICCLPLSLNSMEYYQSVGQNLSRKFDFSHIYFHLSNHIIDGDKSNRNKRFIGSYLKKSDYLKLFDEINIDKHSIADFRVLTNIEGVLL